MFFSCAQGKSKCPFKVFSAVLIWRRHECVRWSLWTGWGQSQQGDLWPGDSGGGDSAQSGTSKWVVFQRGECLRFKAFYAYPVVMLLYHNTPHGGIRHAAVFLFLTRVNLHIYLCLRRKGAITGTVCARNLRGVSALVASPSLLPHTHSSGAARWRLSILQWSSGLLCVSSVCVCVALKCSPGAVSCCVFSLTGSSSSCPAYWMQPACLSWTQACRWVACSVEWPVPSTRMVKSSQTPLQLRRR